MPNALATLEGNGLPSPTGSLSSPPERPPARPLTRKQKAAIIVRLLLAEGAKLSLADLPEGLQAELINQMSGMRFVDRATLKRVIGEFVAEIEDVGLCFPVGLEGALSVLDGTIDAATAARMRQMSGITLTGDPWEVICTLETARLLPVLEQESTEIAAVLLSKLKIATAAELLSQLPGPMARRIAYAVSQTGGVAPEVVEKIGRSLADQLEAVPTKAFTDDPVERVGAILNFSPATTRDQVLEGLDQDDAPFASAVRRAIFTFANIPARVDPRDIPKVTRDVDQAVLITALAGATGDLQDVAGFILGAMSKRMAEQLREEMENLGKVKESDAETAMNTVVAAIRDLEAAGEIVLTIEEDEA